MATLQTRVMNILKTPATEWPVIAGESTEIGRLLTEYIMPLSAIPVLASFVSLALIGSSALAGVRIGMTAALTGVIVVYLAGLANVFICALVVEWLATKFKSSGSLIDALKLVAYALTAFWIASAANVIPILGGLIAIAGGIYTIYLFYLGLPHIMKTPPDQVVIYMIVSAVVMVLVYLVLGAIVRVLTLGPTVTLG